METKDRNDRNNRSTIGSPDGDEGTPANDFNAKLAAAQKLAAAMPYNVNKVLEHGDVSVSPGKGSESGGF